MPARCWATTSSRWTTRRMRGGGGTAAAGPAGDARAGRELHRGPHRGHADRRAGGERATSSGARSPTPTSSRSAGPRWRTPPCVENGAVSQLVAAEMARGARRGAESTLALSVTGIAGPGRGDAREAGGNGVHRARGPDGTEVKRTASTGTGSGSGARAPTPRSTGSGCGPRGGRASRPRRARPSVHAPRWRSAQPWMRAYRTELLLFLGSFFVLACFSAQRFLRQSAAPHFVYQARPGSRAGWTWIPRCCPTSRTGPACGGGRGRRCRCDGPPRSRRTAGT